jgi:hypothetical protein
LQFLETQKQKSGDKNKKKVILHHLLFISFLRNSIEKTREQDEKSESATERDRERQRAREKQRRRRKAKGRTLNLSARKRS